MIPLHDEVKAPTHCRLCMLYHTRDDYNRLWGGPGLAVATPVDSPPIEPRRRSDKPRLSWEQLAERRR